MSLPATELSASRPTPPAVAPRRDPWMERFRQMLDQIDDALYLAGIWTVIIPASYVLPVHWVRALGRWLGTAMMLAPRARHLRRDLAHAFQLSQRDAIRAMRRDRLRMFTDFVSVRWLRQGKTDIEQWEVTEYNAAAVETMRRSGQSYLIATGHFSREATATIHARKISPHHLSLILATLPARSFRPSLLRLRTQLSEILGALRRMRPDDMDQVYVGAASSHLVAAIHRARKPGSTIIITADTPWYHEGSYARPFAGHAMLPLSTATAKLARLAQIPIVTCVPVLLGPRRIAIHWSNPILPPPRRDDQADQRIMDEVIDFLEKAIGDRPEQYSLPIGGKRRWNRANRSWE